MTTNRTADTASSHDRICPKCKGTGNVGYCRDYGICYRCNGFGTLNPDGSKKLTAAERREKHEAVVVGQLIAHYQKDPRFAPLKQAAEAKYGDCLDGFLYTSDIAIAEALYADDHAGADPYKVMDLSLD